MTKFSLCEIKASNRSVIMKLELFEKETCLSALDCYFDHKPNSPDWCIRKCKVACKENYSRVFHVKAPRWRRPIHFTDISKP